LTVWVIRVWEEQAPEGEEPLEWVLLTSVPTTTLEQAWERVDWYRHRWLVENGLHFRRDVTLGEDRCGVRFPPVAQMLAVLNTVVLSLMDVHRVSNVARQIRRFSSHPDEALAWVL
jgi:hypothetical protein